MSYINGLAHHFQTSASGRKLHRQRADHADGVAQADTAAAIQAGIYVRGLLEAKTGDRNFEDLAETVPKADHQRVQHFISDAPRDESKVLDEVSAQANGLLGGTPLSSLIGDESGFRKKGLSSAGVARQHNGRLGKVDN
jgi:SRSO17 transposase